MIKFEIPRSEIEQLIDQWILSERDRELMKRRWLDGLTIEQTAEDADLSVRHTKRLIKKYENIVLRQLTKN